jgi:cell fate regulator YaaT (PSP1 superfamily)
VTLGTPESWPVTWAYASRTDVRACEEGTPVPSLVCAVSFERYGRLHYVDPGPFRPRVGDKVLVPTDEGAEVAECIWAAELVDDEFGSLPVLVGLAGEEDVARDVRHRALKAEARSAVKRLVREHGLPMKVVGIDYSENAAAPVVDAPNGKPADRRPGPRFTVYFSAPERVDFRALVRDLARVLSARVELRQLGARDEAKVQGGIGPCGRELCCATFLRDFEPVAVRMAKDQDLPLNPLKISGACGRLMCCLKYEHPLYQEFKVGLPKLGTTVEVPAGEGKLVGYNVPAGEVTVRLAGSGDRCSCSRASVCMPRKAYETRSTSD